MTNFFLKILDIEWFKIKEPAYSSSDESPLPGSWMTLSLCLCMMEGVRELSDVSFKWAVIPLWRLHPPDLITSQIYHLLIASHWGVRIATY